DPDPTQRTTALELLGAAKNPHAAAPLLSLAETGSSISERAQALIAVGLIGEAQHVARLRSLADKVERRLLPLVLWAIARSDAAQNGDLFLRYAGEHRDASVRAMAVLVLGATRERRALPLLNSLQNDRRTALRAAVLWSLVRIDMAPYQATLREAAV